jgi:hypothetical protein
MCQIKVVEKTKIHFMFNNFYLKSCDMWDNVEKYSRVVEATDSNIMRQRFSCRITKTRMQTIVDNIEHLLPHCWLNPSDLIKRFAATLTKAEERRNDFSVIKICLANCTSKEGREQKSILSFQCNIICNMWRWCELVGITFLLRTGTILFSVALQPNAGHDLILEVF